MLFLNFFYFLSIFFIFSDYLEGLSSKDTSLLINLKEKFNVMLREINNVRSLEMCYGYQTEKTNILGSCVEREYSSAVERLKNLFNSQFDSKFSLKFKTNDFSEKFNAVNKINSFLECLKKKEIDVYIQKINDMLKKKNDPIDESFVNDLTLKISDLLLFLIELFVNDVDNILPDVFEYRFKCSAPEDNLSHLLTKIIKIYEILFSFDLQNKGNLIKIPQEPFNFVAFHYCASFGDFLFQGKSNNSDSLRNLKHYLKEMGCSESVSAITEPFFDFTKFICEHIPFAAKKIDINLTNCPEIPLKSLEKLYPSTPYDGFVNNRLHIYKQKAFRNTCKLCKLVRQEAISIKDDEFELAKNLVKTIYSIAQLFAYINIANDIEAVLLNQSQENNLVNELKDEMTNLLLIKSNNLDKLQEIKGSLLVRVQDLIQKTNAITSLEDKQSYLDFAKRSLWGMERDLSEDGFITKEESAYVSGAIVSSIGLTGLLLRRGYTTYLNIRNINKNNKNKLGKTIRPTNLNNLQSNPFRN